MNRSYREAALFVVATLILSWLEEWHMIAGRDIHDPLRIFCLMWTPGVVAVALSLLRERNAKSLALRVPNLKSVLISYLLPLVIALLVGFVTREFAGTLLRTDLSGSAVLAFALPSTGLILAFASAVGEELGWRGYLQTKLQELGKLKKYLLTGLIWSAWHWPLVWYAGGPELSPTMHIFLFTVSLSSFSFFLGLWRDRTRSMFPAALAHASHNIWIVGVLPVFYKPGAEYLTGESGLLCAFFYLSLAALLNLKFLQGRQNSLARTKI